MNSDRDAKNRKIAEGLGWRFKEWIDREGNDTVTLLNPQGDVVKWAYLINGKTFQDKSSSAISSDMGQIDLNQFLPDFYTSESANALVLEAMVDRSSDDPWISDTEVRWSTNEKAWQCTIRGNWIAGQDPDRKTAIAEAYIRWREAQ